MAKSAVVLLTSLPYGYVLPALMLYGFGNGLIMSQLNRVLLHDIEPAVTGSASGMATTIRQGAAACGIAASGAMFVGATKQWSIHAALTPGMLMSATALAVGAFLAWRVSAMGEPGSFRADAEPLVKTDAQLSGAALTVPDTRP